MPIHHPHPSLAANAPLRAAEHTAPTQQQNEVEQQTKMIQLSVRVDGCESASVELKANMDFMRVQHEAEDELTRRESEERAREEEPASHALAQAEARTSREAQDRVRREAEAPSDSRSDLAHETPQAAEAAEEVRVSSAPHEAERGLRLRCSARPTAQPEAEQDGIVERPAKSPARTRPPAARPMQSPAGVRHQHGVYELLERVVTGVVMVGAGWLASWSVARLSTMSSDAGLQWVRDWFTPKP